MSLYGNIYRWNIVKGYNILRGNVAGKNYDGVYDNNLNMVYKSINLANEGHYRANDGTNTIFFNKDGKELFRIPYAANSVGISWSIFNGNNALRVWDYSNLKSPLIYIGLYDNNLNLVRPIPEKCDAISVYKGSLRYTSGTNSFNPIYYYYDSNLDACEAPKDPAPPTSLSELYKLPYSYQADSLVMVDGFKFVLGSKSEVIDSKYVTDRALFNTSNELVYDNFTDIYPNGLCTIKDAISGKIKLVQLSVKTLKNASKEKIELDNNVMKGNINVNTDNANSIKISIESAKNVIPEGASLCAGILQATDGERFVLAQTALANIASKFTVFDIDLLSSTNLKVQPDGNIKITLDIPSTYSTSSLKVYRIETDGTKTDMKAIIVGGRIVFETNHFSIYVLSDETPKVNAPTIETPTVEAPTVEAPTVEAPTVETPTVEIPTVTTPIVETTSAIENTNVVPGAGTNGTTAPATMDSSMSMYYIILILVAIGCLATTLLFKKKKYNKE